MAIEYYRANNKSYLSDINIDGDVTLKPTKAIFKIKLNGICEIELNLPYDKECRWELIEKDGVIKSPTPFSNWQLFCVHGLKRGMNGLIVKARHIFFDLYKSTVEDIRAVDKTCEEALNILLDGTLYTGKSDIKRISTCYFIEKNRISLINGDGDNTILKRWGGELFLDNFNVYVNEHIGDDYNVEVNYGKNLLDIGLNEDYTNVVTRGKPKAYNGIRLPELYVDSPLINNYRIVYEDFIDMDDLKLKNDSQDGEGFDTEEELYDAMRARMKLLYDNGLDKPTVSGNIDVAPLENTEKYKHVKGLVNIGLGDTIHVNHKNIGCEIQARCIGYDWDILTKKYIKVYVGDEIKNYFNNSSDINNKVNNIIASNGSVKANSIEGIINGVKTQMKACRDTAQPLPVRVMICEDFDKESPSYGAMCFGSMGFMIASERTLDGRDWNWRTFGTGKGFFADLIVAGTMLADRIRGGVLQSIDGSLEIDLRETSKGIQFKKNGAKAIDIEGQKIIFFDWEGSTREIPVCMIYSGRLNGEENKPGVSISGGESCYIGISYYDKESKKYKPYALFDSDNVSGYNVPITFFKAIQILGGLMLNGYSLNLDSEGASIYGTKGKVVIKSKNDVSMLYSKSDECNYSYYDLVSLKNHKVNGDLAVVGTKNCIQNTKHYGDRLYYATEDCESLLTDTGKGITKITEFGTYESVILIDNIYKESVDLSDYYVFLTKYNNGDIWVKEQTDNYFIVESNQPLKFNWKIEATRKGYEGVRLEEYNFTKEVNYEY